MFEGFDSRQVELGDATIFARQGGPRTGAEPVLLLHGYPQTHAMWRWIAPALARERPVVLTDLRGYGDSSCPAGGADHAAYSKRAMALDQVRVMEQLGFDRFAVVAHDRGARVAHRLLLDHPQRVTRAALLDIAPTYDMYAATDQAFATAYFHWFFLIQPGDLPERLIGADPEFFLRRCLKAWSRVEGAFGEEAMAEYIRCFSRPEVIHATCEDYRAAAGIDLEHDAADRDRRIRCPLLVLWGGLGFVGRRFDVLALWRERAANVRGGPLPCGHFLPEEAPEATRREIAAFLGDVGQEPS
jgi:haloacetate dehalogenase